MKRTISEITPAAEVDQEIVELPPRRAINESVNSHADHLTRLLITICDMIAMKEHIKDGDLHESLTKLCITTPQAAMFGQQSSGKSATADWLYCEGKKVLYSSHNLGTCCPLEIRIGPQYKDTAFYFINDDERIDFNSLVAAQEYSRTANSLVYAKIIMEHHSDTTSTVVIDLPGANAHETNKQYMQVMREHYLQLQQSVILHIVNANSDEDNDNSTQFITGLEHSVVRVYTHIDELKTEEQKKHLLERLRRDDRAAVVCCRPDEGKTENDVINSLKEYIPDGVYKGISELRDFVTTFLHQKTEALIPEYEARTSEILSLCDQELLSLGRTKPDLTRKRYDFQNDLRDRIANVFKLHGDLHDDDAAVRDIIAVDVLKRAIDTVPNIDELTKELSKSSDGELPGSEGWGVAGKRYMRMMCDKVMEDHIKPAIHAYEDLYMRVLDRIYVEYPDKTFVTQALATLHTTAQDELKLAMLDIMQSVEHQIDIIKTNPYSGSLLTAGVHETPISESVKVFVTMLFKLKFERVAKLFERGPEGAYADLMRAHQLFYEKTSAYETQARVMRETLHILWTEFSQHIHDDIVRLVRSRIVKLQGKLGYQLNEVDRNLVCETEEHIRRRNLVNDLRTKCESAINQLQLI